MRYDENIFQTLLQIQDTDSCIYSEEELRTLSKHPSALIRHELCYALISYRQDFARSLWIRLIADKSHLVRLSAAECMDVFPGDEEVCAALLSAYRKEKHVLTRGYIVYSLLAAGFSNRETVELVENSLRKEHYYFVRLMCYYGLYRFCQRDVLDQIIGCFRAQKLGTRRATANALTELLEDGLLKPTDLKKVSNAIQKYASKDDPLELLEGYDALREAIKSVQNSILEDTPPPK